MKKLVLPLVLLLTLALAGTASAQGGASIDVSGNYASEPASGFGGTFGLEIGGNVDFDRLGIAMNLGEGVRAQARAALGYYNWDDTMFGFDIEARRIPLFLGGRFLVPTSSPLSVNLDLGLELSFDDVEVATPFGTMSDSEVNLGIRPQAGILYPVSDKVTVGAHLAWHLISDDYFTLGVSVGFNLQ